MRIARHLLLAAVITAIGGIFLGRPPFAQDLGYHAFADTRGCFGLPNCLNVLSNLPFALVGILGIRVTFRGRRLPPSADDWERWPYAALFLGTSLTAAGSSYYHLAPDNARLVWDRLPMAIGFMGLLTAIMQERVGTTLARWLFVPLLVAGPATVVYWYWTELSGRGDLRPYFLVQFGSLAIVLLLLLLYPSRRGGSAYLFAGVGFYALAKAVESADRAIFAFGQIVSGHTLKHLFAAMAIACVVRMVRVRNESDADAQHSRSAAHAALGAHGRP